MYMSPFTIRAFPLNIQYVIFNINACNNKTLIKKKNLPSHLIAICSFVFVRLGFTFVLYNIMVVLQVQIRTLHVLLTFVLLDYVVIEFFKKLITFINFIQKNQQLSK